MQGRRSGSRPIRILLADLPGLLAGVVKSAVAMQTDMQIVAEVRGDPGTDGGPVATSIDVVVTTLSDSRVTVGYQGLLFADQHIPLVALSPDGERVEVYARRVVREVALHELVAVIRDVAAPGEARGIAAEGS